MKYRIRELRKALGWTGQDLADRVGTTKGYISELETGKRDGGIPMLQSIAKALGVSEGDLFEPESDDDRAAMQHMQDFMRLTAEDREAVRRHARGLLPKDAG